MRSPNSITGISFIIFVLVLASAVWGQRVMVLAPDKTDQSRDVAWKLEQELIAKVQLQDSGIGAAAISAAPPSDAYNMTAAESIRLGSAAGSDFLVIVRSNIQRRSASARDKYYEAYAVVYLVSTRTGRLVHWKLVQFEADKPEESARKLERSLGLLAAELVALLRPTTKNEVAEKPLPTMEEPPDADSPLAKNFKAPIPFRRIKPEYTSLAAFYEIAATVDILIDLDAKGQILRTEIVRWAGYGLDESVEKAVREMNWRPAERDGKFLPMRFLVRYNFKKIEKTTN